MKTKAGGTVKAVDEQEVVRLWAEQNCTLRQISAAVGIDHHRVKRILLRNGQTFERRYNYEYTDEHRRKIGEKSKGRIPKNKGVPADEQSIRKYIKARMRTQIDLDKYEDLGKLRILINLSSKHLAHWGRSDEDRQAFFDRFYFDEAFNAIYDAWLRNGKDKWWYPSLDHKDPKSNGGGWYFENLQFLTWFENRAKADMTAAQWETFKAETQTTSKLFIEEILNDYRANGGEG